MMAIQETGHSGTELIESYRESRKRLRDAYDSAPEEDKPIITGMITSCTYAIEWMKTGSQPMSKARLSSDAREALWDPEWLAKLATPPKPGEPRNLTDDEKHAIHSVLHQLSAREQQCFMLRYGLLYTNEQIATELKVKKGAVQTYIERAHEKIEKFKQQPALNVAGRQGKEGYRTHSKL